jgi:hypothetical protein
MCGTIKVYYSTLKYNKLCFRCAMQQAALGIDVDTEIFQGDLSRYCGTVTCERCETMVI